MEILRQYYETLGISPGASLDEISQAYKDAVTVWNPDHFESNPRLKETALENIKDINTAYEKLSIFFREYGAPNFTDAQEQQSQNLGSSHKEPLKQPEVSASPKYKHESIEAIWNPNALAAWSLLFTPAFGSFLLVLNWGTLKQPSRASSAKNGFYVSLLVPVIYIILVLADAAGSALVISFFWLVIWYFGFALEQAKYVNDQFGSSYPKKSWSNAVLVGAIGLFAYFILCFILAFVAH